MADTNFTQADNVTNKFDGASTETLIALIDTRANEIFEKISIIECVARGGASLANSLNLDGDPTDSVSGGIFSSIISTANDMSGHYELRDAIAALRRLTVQSTASA